MKARFWSILIAGLLAVGAAAAAGPVIRVNIIDGSDERASILEVGAALGLTPAEIARIRRVSGHAGCTEPQPVFGSGALYLANDQILTAGHIFFERSGKMRRRCFFRPQMPGSRWIPLEIDPAHARFGAVPPKPGSNDDWAVVKLTVPIAGAEPFPVADTRAAAGDRLIVVTAQPAGFEDLDPNVPVAQGCRIRRAPISTAATNFYRTDCDATGASSGGMHLARIDGTLKFRGITISTGPWRDEAFRGAPYDERAGSVTTALATDAAILTAGRALAGKGGQ